MSHPTTSTDFDKYGTFKITTSNAVKRASNESLSHDDDSKKLRLEKSGSSSSVLSMGAGSATNSVNLGSLADSSVTKKLKTRKICSDGSTVQQYQLVVEDSAGALSEESSSGVTGAISESSTKTYSTSGGGEEMVLIRKQIASKSSDSNEVGVEERIIHIEGDPGGTTSTSFLTTVSTKTLPKRLQLGVMDTRKSLGESIDLKLIPATSDGTSAGKFSIPSTGEKKPDQQILLTASSSAISSQNTFTYSRVCSVGSVPSSSGDSVNIKGLQGTVKNQSLMVSSKKLLPEVTQTTAKVSIGNTTISVPLLKPLNSSQIIQAGSSVTSQSGPSDGTKSVIHTIQASSSHSPQTQLSKILNIKRGQKVTQPTFVSLSQLQIKPVPSAKIVQAKVLSKKIPLHIQAVQTNKSTLLQQTSGVVTITSSKAELPGQGHIMASPQKKQQINFIKDLPTGAVVKTTTNTNCEELSSTASQASSTLTLSETTSGNTVLSSDKNQFGKSSSGSSENSVSSIISSEFLPAGVKVVHTSTSPHLSNATMRQSANQAENADQSQTQTQRISICPTISIVRQNSPQLVTSTGNMSTVSLSMADTVSGQQKLILTKSQFANVSSSSMSTSGANTVTANFPRNISLMFAKNAAGQQVFTNAGGKTTLCVTTSANSSVNKAGGRMNLSISSNVLTSSSSSSISTASTPGSAAERDATASATDLAVSGAETSLQTQTSNQNMQSNVIPNRKIIQVLPGNLYSSSGGSFLQITKAKVDTDDEKKKLVESEHSTGQQKQTVQQIQIQQIQQQQQTSQQQQQIHLQIQQGQGHQSHQSSQQQQQQQQQQQHQMQVQQQQNQPQHIQIQQIQSQMPQTHQQQRQQLLQQHRQQLVHKHQLQQQLQKQQHIMQQQQQQQQQLQQQPTQNQEATSSTDTHQNQTIFASSTPTIAPHSTTDSNPQQLHPGSGLTSHPAAKSEESNNVLLKQLLQNSNSTPVSNQSNSQSARINSVSAPASAALPSRKVINVRAPSLGLVSSLEAQLARPVIPPVPASESSTQSASTPASTQPQTSSSLPPTPTAPMPQSTKMTIESVKVVSALQPGYSSASTASLSTSTTSAPSIIISTSKGHSSIVTDKSKFTSTPLISKETSFVSKPTITEPPEQKIEIFSLQSSGGDNSSKLEPQQQPFKSFSTSTHNSTGQAGSSITTKITKYVHEAKKSGDHQQHQQLLQQQHLTVTRTYNSNSSTNGGNLSIGNPKEKTAGSNVSVNAHPSSQATAPVQNVSQQQHQAMTNSMQQTNLQDSNSQANVTDGSIASAQQMSQSSSNPVHLTQMPQQQHLQQSVATTIDTTIVKLEPEEANNSVNSAHLKHINQMQQQQHQTPYSRQNSTAPSPMSTTPTNSVPSTPTAECQTPITIVNKQILQQHTPVSSTQTPQTSATSAPSSGSKEGEQRKKRKRDQPKQPKKQPANTKETAAASTVCSANAANAANNKKRSRKSLKLEEDYDTFIDNLMLHLRQMPPMQVLEPKLNVNYGVCNLYGWRNWTRPSSNNSSNSPPKETRQNERANLFENELVGEFGSAYLPNKVPLYDLVPLGDSKSRNESNSSSTMQNNYYDQEFKSFTYKTEAEKLTSWCKVYRERAVDTPEVVSNKVMLPIDPVKTMRLNMLQQETFPGLILMSSTQQKLGRMSPVIPIVNPMALITKRKKTPLKQLDNEAVQHGMYIKEQTDDIDCKLGLKPNVNNQNVILSLPASSADRLLDVLKNLANLLQINAPIPYKVVDDAESETDQKPITMSESESEMAMKFIAIQDILNGRSKMCRHCGKAIKGRCIKNNEQCTKSPMLEKLRGPLPPRYFCNKICYVQFRWSNEKKLPGSASFKSVLASKEGPQSDDSLMADILDVKPDIKALEESQKASEVKPVEPVAKTKKVCFRYFNSKCFQPFTPIKRMSEKELRDMLFRMDITMSATTPHNLLSDSGGSHQQAVEDRRTCVLCSHVGDGVADGPARLLNYDVDKWVHLNCALWSTDVYETISGGLMNFPMALQMGLNQTCVTCQQLGATVKCHKTRCGAVFHLPCAIRDQCVFYQDKTIHCHAHSSRNDKDKELLTLAVPRRVYVERDENRQVAAIMHHSEMVNLLRVGSLIFLNVGQLLPHQLEAFHTPNHIYPIGYKMIRFYWSMRHPNKRCRYICSIAEVAGKPEFRIVVQEPSESDVDLRDSSPKAVWQRVLQPIAEMRKAHNLVKLYPEFISGEDLFGLTEPTIVRIIESLPGVETLTNYRFKYGRNPLLDLPLALNPSGAARTEPKLRQLMGWKKHHPQRTCSNVSSVGGGGHQGSMTSVAAAGEVTCPYSKQFVHSKSSQYKKMKQEWRNNVYLARSKIQGLGLYAARDLEKHTMIIEYIGEVIRTEVSEIREKQYEARNRGIYMFRLDEDRVVDATLSGGLARYINHSCNPNCVTEIVEVDRELRIIIFAKRRINRSEELSYDYKFDIEDDGSKIPCMCGAPNCRKWMN